MRCAGFQSPLAEGIQRFLLHKRALGRRFETEEWSLRLLDRFLVEHGISTMTDVTAEVVDVFLASRPRRSSRSYNQLLGVLRRLFDWLVAHTDLDRSPVHGCSRHATGQRIPFIFDAEQAHRLLELAGELPDACNTQLRGPTYRTIFALLYGLGFRVGEVCRLCVQDLDPKRRLLVIRQTKFAKSRLVPFGPRLGKLLQHYLALREARCVVLAPNAPLFSMMGNRPVGRGTIGSTFRNLLPELDLKVPPGSSPPRLHSLRHSFAVGTLLRWYRAGMDPAQRLLHLSTFLGHVSPESTAVYLTITDALLQAASERFACPVFKEVSK